MGTAPGSDGDGQKRSVGLVGATAIGIGAHVRRDPLPMDRQPGERRPRQPVGIVIVLYILISIVVVGSLSPEEIAKAADFALAQAAATSLGQVGFTLVAISAVLATFSAINATLYGSARLSFTIATEGELPAALEKRTWNQPIGLHITAGAGLIVAIALPLASISSLASAIFLTVFAVVNVAAFRGLEGGWLQKGISGFGFVGCIGSLVILIGQSISSQPISMIALVGLVGSALAIEHLVLRNRRTGPIAQCHPR